MKKLVKKYGTLSRKELKEIQGGSGGVCLGLNALCHTTINEHPHNRCCEGTVCVEEPPLKVNWGRCKASGSPLDEIPF